MVNQERMEESSATATTRSTRRREKEIPEEEEEHETSSETGSETTEFTIAFKPFSVTPNLEDVSKELKGTKKEPLANVVASHPTDMKDVILDRGTKMLDLHFKINQKKEALSKQQATNDEQTSYIPGSLRVGNPIAVPNYLKGSIILQEIEERGNIENETRKESFAGIAIDMTRAVVEETREMLKTEFFKTVGIISELLVVNFEEHAVDVIEYGRINSSESLASYAAYIFIQDHLGDSEMGVLLGLTEPDKAMKMYRKLHGSEKPDTYERNACMVARYLAETVASSLGNVMKQLTVVLFDFH